MHNILHDIVEKKCMSLYAKKNTVPLMQMRKKASGSRPARPFISSMTTLKPQTIGLIAEIKLASPSMPHIYPPGQIIDRAIAYEQAGAQALSFITETHYFHGNIDYIPRLKQKTTIPVLQKDFVIDDYQIYEAKAAGADAFLLIARLVSGPMLQKFVSIAKSIGLEPVVEINNRHDLEQALTTQTAIIAVNARDLQTFTVNIEAACSLLSDIPDSYVKLGFSGVSSPEYARMYKDAGARGILVGTSLMKAGNTQAFIKSLRNI